MNVNFGEYELSTDRLELRRAGRPVAIEPQVFDVLAHLVSHRERVVTRHELLDGVWGDRFVSDSALASRVKTARRLIGDTGRDQRMIKTIHGRGYRFVADVVPLERPPQPVVTRAPGAASGRLVGLVGDLASGAGGAVELVGEAEATADAVDGVVDEALGAGLVVGRATGAARGGRQLSCVIEALDEMAQRRAELLDEIPGPCRAELQQLFAGAPPSTRQRLFVAVREFLVAAGRVGAVLVLEDLTGSDPDTLALVRDAARVARRHPLAVVVSHRGPGALTGFELVPVRGPSHTVEGSASAAAVSPAAAEVLARAALAGSQIDHLDLRAAADGDEAVADLVLHEALAAGVLETTTSPGGAHFADSAVRDQLLGRLPSEKRGATRVAFAHQLEAVGAGPDRVARQLLEAGRRSAAAPFALAAARSAAPAQLHGEVLRWADAARPWLTGPDAAEVLALKADALAATGAPTAVAAYRAALAVAPHGAVGGLRARLARAAMLTGDLASASEALEGLEPDGGPFDGAILLARGVFAYFGGDLDGAQAAADAARSLALAPGAPAQLLDVITLQGMIAHNRGEWFDRLRRELRATSENPALAMTVFDSHLCVAEYLLYGPTTYEEIRRLTTDLRAQGERSGARHAVAFAVTVSGEAALLAGELDDARRDLTEALRLHGELGADTGMAHAMQRLAEVELQGGDRAAAEHLARRAVPLGRWSPLSRHLLQRVYGTLISAAPDASAAAAVVDEANETLEPMACAFCQVMFEVPAAIACAEVGRLEDARAHLAMAQASAARWQGTAWEAAVTEAKAYLARAEGRPDDGDVLLGTAASLFAVAGQPLDAERCREASGSSR